MCVSERELWKEIERSETEKCPIEGEMERELTQNAFQLVFIQFDAVSAQATKTTMVLG